MCVFYAIWGGGGVGVGISVQVHMTPHCFYRKKSALSGFVPHTL